MDVVPVALRVLGEDYDWPQGLVDSVAPASPVPARRLPFDGIEIAAIGKEPTAGFGLVFVYFHLRTQTVVFNLTNGADQLIEPMPKNTGVPHVAHYLLVPYSKIWATEGRLIRAIGGEDGARTGDPCSFYAHLALQHGTF